MRLTEKQANKLVGVAWVDYFRGYPNLCDYRAENNNWRKMHHLPIIRRMGGGEEMKNKSLEFVKKSIESGMYKNVKINDFDTMKEVPFISFIERFFILNKEIIRFDDGTLRYSHELKECEKGIGLINAKIVHDEDEDFQYFIAEEYICDGTMSFHFSLYKEILERLYYLKTFFKKSEPKDLEKNPWKYDIKYTVGNFVLCSKYSDEFSTEEKPWLKERVAVMLPVRSEFIEK